MPAQISREIVPGGVTVTSSETFLTWLNGNGGSSSIIKLDGKRIQTLVIRLANTGAALTALNIYGKLHPNDSVWVPLAITANEYITDTNPFLDASIVRATATGAYVDANAFVLGTGNYAVLVIINPCFSQLKIGATCGTSTVVTGYAVGYDTVVPLHQRAPHED